MRKVCRDVLGKIASSTRASHLVFDKRHKLIKFIVFGESLKFLKKLHHAQFMCALTRAQFQQMRRFRAFTSYTISHLIFALVA
jgi:hypothetical protein